jgi:hypothetical protein
VSLYEGVSIVTSEKLGEHSAHGEYLQKLGEHSAHVSVFRSLGNIVHMVSIFRGNKEEF